MSPILLKGEGALRLEARDAPPEAGSPRLDFWVSASPWSSLYIEAEARQRDRSAASAHGLSWAGGLIAGFMEAVFDERAGLRSIVCLLSDRHALRDAAPPSWPHRMHDLRAVPTGALVLPDWSAPDVTYWDRSFEWMAALDRRVSSAPTDLSAIAIHPMFAFLVADETIVGWLLRDLDGALLGPDYASARPTADATRLRGVAARAFEWMGADPNRMRALETSDLATRMRSSASSRRPSAPSWARTSAAGSGNSSI